MEASKLSGALRIGLGVSLVVFVLAASCSCSCGGWRAIPAS